MNVDINEKKYMMKTDPLHLEPRVVKLEAGLDILTKNVTDLTTAVRENAISLDSKLERLTVAVTEAAAPKKTDWSTIIAAVMMVLAVGAAALIPLNNTSQDNKTTIEKNHTTMIEHQKLDMHPVGWALVQRIEDQLKTHILNNEKEFKSHVDNDEKEIERIITHYHEELTFLRENFENQLKAAKDRNDQFNDKIYSRVVKLEDQNKFDSEREKDELQMWRQKAMGLSTPNAVVPLVPRDSSK